MQSGLYSKTMTSWYVLVVTKGIIIVVFIHFYIVCLPAPSAFVNYNVNTLSTRLRLIREFPVKIATPWSDHGTISSLRSFAAAYSCVMIVCSKLGCFASHGLLYFYWDWLFFDTAFIFTFLPHQKPSRSMSNTSHSLDRKSRPHSGISKFVIQRSLFLEIIENVTSLNTKFYSQNDQL